MITLLLSTALSACDDKTLASIVDTSGATGMAFLASTCHRNLFDNVSVEVITSSTGN